MSIDTDNEKTHIPADSISEALVVGEDIDWVRNRMQCTAERFFYKDLYLRLKDDVAARGSGYRLEIDEFPKDGSDPSMLICHNRLENRSVEVFWEGDRIRVEPYRKKKFYVVLNWLEETAQCSIRVLDEGTRDWELWQISQRVLYDLFFAEDG